MFFFFNDTATTEIYPLSLHDALPISRPYGTHGNQAPAFHRRPPPIGMPSWPMTSAVAGDRKSTRLNSSHSQISYAVFCLKKKNPGKERVQPPNLRSARRRSAPRRPVT